MELDRLEGIVPPLLTPIDKNEKVDKEGLRRLIRYVINGGVDGIFILGSTGEGFSLLDKEKIRAIEITVEEVNKRIPVYVSISATGTKKAIENALIARKTGGDIVVCTIPYYLKHNRDEIITHYKELADKTQLPILIYNHPLTKINIDLETYQILSRYSKIVGVKESSADFIYFQQLLHLFKKNTKFKIFQGSEYLMLYSLFSGADGCIAAIANIVPKWCSQLYKAVKSGEYKKALQLQNRIISLCEGLYFSENEKTKFPSSFFSGLKYALNIMGICDSYTTKPFVPLTKTDKLNIKNILKGIL